MDQHYSYYNEPTLSRSLEEIMAMSKKSTGNFCCQHQPLLNIELDHVVPDELPRPQALGNRKCIM